jgi:hypothetical protein
MYHCPVLRGMAVHNQRQLEAALAAEPASPHLLIDLAREAVLANCHRAPAGVIPAGQWLAFLRRVYRTALERCPRSLVARFNSIRVMLHFGTPDLVSEALALLDETLALPPDHWQVEVMEDVFPWDFFPQFFNYRRYFDRVTEHLMEGTPVHPDLCGLMRASLHAYRGFYPAYHGVYSQSLDDFQAAAALDPDFPYFQLWYAEQLLLRGLPEDLQAACSLLRELAESSLVFLEASEMLERTGGQPAELARRTARAREVLDVDRSIAIPKLRPDLREAERKRPAPERVLQRLDALHTELDRLRDRIRAMESSKFWRLRKAWFRLKCRLGLAKR